MLSVHFYRESLFFEAGIFVHSSGFLLNQTAHCTLANTLVFLGTILSLSSYLKNVNRQSVHVLTGETECVRLFRNPPMSPIGRVPCLELDRMHIPSPWWTMEKFFLHKLCLHRKKTVL